MAIKIIAVKPLHIPKNKLYLHSDICSENSRCVFLPSDPISVLTELGRNNVCDGPTIYHCINPIFAREVFERALSFRDRDLQLLLPDLSNTHDLQSERVFLIFRIWTVLLIGFASEKVAL